MIEEILVKTLTCLLIYPLFLARWKGIINLIYLFIYIFIYLFFSAIIIHTEIYNYYIFTPFK